MLPLCSRLFAILLLLHSFSWLALLFYYHSFDLKTKEIADDDNADDNDDDDNDYDDDNDNDDDNDDDDNADNEDNDDKHHLMRLAGPVRMGGWGS